MIDHLEPLLPQYEKILQQCLPLFKKIDTYPIDHNQLFSNLETLANMNTHSENEVGQKKFVDYLQHQLPPSIQQKTIEIRDSGPLLLFSQNDGADITALFSCHYDTVFPITSPFQKCTKKSPDIIKGPGVIDMKGSIVLVQYLLKIIETLEFQEKKNLCLKYILTPDEEIGSIRSKKILKSIIEPLSGHHAIGVVLEPTLSDGAHILSRPGSCTIKISSHGVSAHVGRDFQSGKNAVTALMSLFSKIESAFQKDEYLLKNTIVHIASIHGGKEANIVPNFAEGILNIRADHDETIQSVLSIISQYINNTQIAGIEYRISIVSERPAKPITQDLLQMIELYQKVTKHPIEWKRSGGVSDGNLLQSFGLTTLDGMGATGGALHTEEEWCSISSLETRIRELTRFIVFLAHLPKKSIPTIHTNNGIRENRL